MADFQNFDWSPLELYDPIWVEPNFCVCLEGVYPPDGAFVIRLRRSKVFGTGGHPATRAILLKLIHKELDEGIRVIDFWCGSGLLGIVCAKFGCDVLHMDDQEESMPEVVENGKLNDLVLAAGEQLDPWVESWQPFDVAPADLLVTHQATLEKLKRDAPKIHSMLKSGGTFVLSGWPPRDHRRMKAQIEEFFEIEEVQDFNNWPVVTARK